MTDIRLTDRQEAGSGGIKVKMQDRGQRAMKGPGELGMRLEKRNKETDCDNQTFIITLITLGSLELNFS